MKQGDFSLLAENYARYRPDYSGEVLRALLAYVGAERAGFEVVDVGAGTGIWTRMLAEKGLSCTAVEPNEAMRSEGIRHTASRNGARWQAGAAENTGLAYACADWVTMASSFHWTRLEEALAEFHRILRPKGYVTVLWNPRDIESHPLHARIEEIVHGIIPDLKRVSSGSDRSGRKYGEELCSTGLFDEVVYFEARHSITMSRERYLGAWRSVNDIQSQAGPERFDRLMREVEAAVSPLPEITVPYQTRAWTARRVD